MPIEETAWGPYCQVRPRSTTYPIADAVEGIAKKLSLVPTEAWAKLRDEALVAGGVKAYRRGFSERDHRLIAPDRWPRALIEVQKQIVIFANGERMIFVDLERSDYEAWLESVAPPTAAPQKSNAGRDDVHDWEDYKLKFVQLWRRNGDFRLPQNKIKGWKSQTTAAHTLLEYIEKHTEPGEEPPHVKTVANKIGEWVAKIDQRGA
jgi:hypothetical protein